MCAAADVRKLLGAKDAGTGVAALTVFSCLAGGDYDHGADRIGPKHAADVVGWLLANLRQVNERCRRPVSGCSGPVPVGKPRQTSAKLGPEQMHCRQLSTPSVRGFKCCHVKSLSLPGSHDIICG